MTLLSSLGFAPKDLQQVAVAGGIGSGINIANAIRIGMFWICRTRNTAILGIRP